MSYDLLRLQKKKDYHSKNVLNLYKKHFVTVAFHVQQFTIGMLNLIGEEITLKMNLACCSIKKIEAIRQLINIDPHIKYQPIQNTLQIESAVTGSILHDYLALRKITCRWMTQFLTEAQKQDPVNYCLAMLKKFDGGRSKRVYDIITGDIS